VVATTTRRQRAAASIVGMASESRRIGLYLVLELDREPIAGTLLGSAGQCCFRGWVDLASALQRLLEQAETGTSGAAARSREGAS
jgi:hypothetical protein